MPRYTRMKAPVSFVRRFGAIGPVSLLVPIQEGLRHFGPIIRSLVLISDALVDIIQMGRGTQTRAEVEVATRLGTIQIIVHLDEKGIEGRGLADNDRRRNREYAQYLCFSTADGAERRRLRGRQS